MQFKKELGRNQSMSDSTDLNELEESIDIQQSLITNNNDDNNSNNDDDLVNDDKQNQNDSEPLFKQGSFTTLMGGRCARTRHNRPDLKQELPLKYQQQPIDEGRKRQLNPIEHENRDAFDLRKELHELMQSNQDSDNVCLKFLFFFYFLKLKLIFYFLTMLIKKEICSCTYELAKTGNAAFFGLCEYSPT